MSVGGKVEIVKQEWFCACHLQRKKGITPLERDCRISENVSAQEKMSVLAAVQPRRG